MLVKCFKILDLKVLNTVAPGPAYRRLLPPTAGSSPGAGYLPVPFSFLYSYLAIKRQLMFFSTSPERKWA